MSIASVIFLTILVCGLWTGIWTILYTEKEKVWMFVLACGPFVWLCLGLSSCVKRLKKMYDLYYYKAVVENENGDKYWCNSNEMRKICDQYDTKPAIAFAKETNYKPYRPESFNFTQNPRYVHRDIACKFPEISLIKEKKNHVWNRT